MRPSILIVDDEFEIADVLATILRENGYDVTTAINGKLGLEAVAHRRPHLLLLDVMMPILDGPAMLQKFREDPANAATPVIFMTALLEAIPKWNPPLHQAALRKPFSPQRLLAQVGALLSDSDGGDGASE